MQYQLESDQSYAPVGSRALALLRSLTILAALGLCLLHSSHAHAQSCSAYYLTNPLPNGNPQGPYSTAGQACAATDYGYEQDCCGYLTLTFEVGGPAPGYPAGTMSCNEVATNDMGPEYIADAGAAKPQGGCTNSYFVQTTVPRAQTCSKFCVGDPINPGVGNVYKTETDVTFAGAGTVAYQRFYNSADAQGIDGVPGWRHSYGRSISTVFGTVATPYPGQSTVVSSEYSAAASACVAGFAQIQGAVPAWGGASAAYTNNVCILSNSSGTVIGTLPVDSVFIDDSYSTSTEYDVIRDDGQTLRYTVQNGVVTNPPGVSIRFALTGSGFTVTDDDDNVETYNSAGALMSITSRSGVVQTIAYDSNGLFLSATDSFGNSITVSRNATRTYLKTL
jgi:YD repeat-containing protein